MIEEDCFSREHIDLQCRRIGANDRQLLEKSIHALALLGHLVESDLEFVFKGGSSLMLLLSPLRGYRLTSTLSVALPGPILTGYWPASAKNRRSPDTENRNAVFAGYPTGGISSFSSPR